MLTLTPGEETAIRAAMEDYMSRRREKQPLEYGSAGSTFKRPVGNYASALVISAGLRAFPSAGPRSAKKHAGFIINRGGATAADVRQLIAEVQRIVREKDRLYPRMRDQVYRMSQRRVRRQPLPIPAGCGKAAQPARHGAREQLAAFGGAEGLRPPRPLHQPSHPRCGTAVKMNAGCAPSLDRHQSAFASDKACLRPSLAIPPIFPRPPPKFTPSPENNTMPSFTTAAKDEILSNKAVRQHFPQPAVLWADGLFSREFSVPKMQMLTRERRAAQYYSQLVQSVRPMTGTVTLREEKLSTGQLAYRVTVDDMADRIDLYNHFAMLYPEGVTFELLGGDEGAGAFLGGVFLACGTLSDPETKYHLEFAVPREELLMMFVALLQDVGFSPLLTQRRGANHRLPAR